MANKVCVIIISLVVVVAIIVGILIGISFSTLEYNELGLDYNSFTKVIDPVPYQSGRHMLGIGHEFIKFPR